MRRTQELIAACSVLVVLLLMGCIPASMLAESTGGKAAQEEAPAAPGAPEAPVSSQAPATPAEEKPEQQSLYGKWTGTVEFTKYTFLMGDAKSRAAFEPGVASTIGQVYSVVLDVYSDTEATLTFDEKTRITGSLTRDGDSVKFVFAKAGDDDFEVGASPPVTFTFTGVVEQTPTRAMSGPVLYEVFAQDGSRAWTEDGEWIVTPE